MPTRRPPTARPRPPAARRRGPRASRPAGERGFALILVLLLSAIAIAIVADLWFQSGCELLAARNVADIGEIEYAIDGQFEVAMAQLRFDKRQNEVDSEFDEWNSTRFRNRTDNDVALTTTVFDEQGKFDLARLVIGSDAQKTHAKEMLARILDLFREGIAVDKTKGGDLDLSEAEDLAERILRHMIREGAVGSVPKPKVTGEGKDVPLLLDELLFVDTKDSRFFSLLMNDVKVKDVVAPGLHRYLTVYGTRKINLNTAPLVVLKAEFSNVSDRDLAQKIIDRRRSAAEETGTSPTPGMSTTPAMSSTSGSTTPTSSSDAAAAGNPFTDLKQLTDGSVEGLTDEVLQRNQIDPAVEFDVKSDVFGIRIQGATERTQRDELYVVERVKADSDHPYGGFRFLLHQERTDPLLFDGDNPTPAGQQ